MPVERKYDSVYETEAPDLPVAYVRALAHGESRQNPTDKTGSHWGLLQVYPPNLNDYNAANNTSHPRNDLLKPDINVRIFAWEAGRIVAMLNRNGVATDWTDPEFVKLFTAGWNSGWSQAGGVGRVLAYLNTHGYKLTHDNVFKFGKAAGATKFLTPEYEAKQRYQRSVASTYFAQSDAPQKLIPPPFDPADPPPARPPPMPSPSTGYGGLFWIALILMALSKN